MRRGRFLLWLVAGPASILVAMLAAAHPYLAITKRSGGDVLVVEGWMEPMQLREVPHWTDSLHYRHIYTTGSVRPFAYYLKAGESIEVRFADPQQGRVALNVAGVPGARFVLVADEDTLMAQDVEPGPVDLLTDREIHARRLRIASIHEGSSTSNNDNIFIRYLRINGENVHLLQDTVVLIHRDGTAEPAWPTYAHKCAHDLRMLGTKAEITTVPAYGRPNSRSWANASWFAVRARSDGITACDVITVGVHARRSRALYRRACGPGVDVGVIALEDPDCPRRGWWWKRTGWSLMLKEIGGSAEPTAVELVQWEKGS